MSTDFSNHSVLTFSLIGNVSIIKLTTLKSLHKVESPIKIKYICKYKIIATTF